MSVHDHRFIYEFQPWTFGTSFIRSWATTALNYGALFAIAYVFGLGLRLGLGL